MPTAITLPAASGGLHVAELARATDVSSATVRYYARIGLLNPCREPENGYRLFSPDDVRRVNFIRDAQELGLSIGEIKSVLSTVDHGELPCDQVRSLVEKRLSRIKAQIEELRLKESHIRRALKSWKRIGNPAPREGELCPLIERSHAADRGLSPDTTHNAQEARDRHKVKKHTEH